MKKRFTAIIVILVFTLILSLCVGCQDKDNGKTKQTVRIAAPEGTPALAITRMIVDNKTIAGKNIEYGIVSPSNIAAEMSSGKASVVIMPINAGANLVRQGADYKLVSVAVNGSLYIIGNADKATIELNDLKGKTIACIGQTGVPGMVLRYILSNNLIKIVTDENAEVGENEVKIKYVADGNAAKTLLTSGNADFALVGEPAATSLRTALKLTSEMDVQRAYYVASDNLSETFPQAGIFVKTELYNDFAFLNELFTALSVSKKWVTENPASVTAFAKENLYQSAVFPEASISRCAINAGRLSEEDKTNILAFLGLVMSKDAKGNSINWEEFKDRIF